MLNDIKSPGNISQFKGERKPKTLKPWPPDTEKRQLSELAAQKKAKGEGKFSLFTYFRF